MKPRTFRERTQQQLSAEDLYRLWKFETVHDFVEHSPDREYDVLHDLERKIAHKYSDEWINGKELTRIEAELKAALPPAMRPTFERYVKQDWLHTCAMRQAAFLLGVAAASGALKLGNAEIAWWQRREIKVKAKIERVFSLPLGLNAVVRAAELHETATGAIGVGR